MIQNAGAIQRAAERLQRLGPHLERLRRSIVGVSREVHVVETYFGNRSEVIRNHVLKKGNQVIGEIDIWDARVYLKHAATSPEAATLGRAIQLAIEKVGAENVIIFAR